MDRSFCMLVSNLWEELVGEEPHSQTKSNNPKFVESKKKEGKVVGN